MAGRVGVGALGGWAEGCGPGGWVGGVAGRMGPGGVWVGGPDGDGPGGPGGPGGVWGGGQGGGEAGRVGRRVGWYGPVAENVYTTRKGVCNGGVKNALLSG